MVTKGWNPRLENPWTSRLYGALIEWKVLNWVLFLLFSCHLQRKVIMGESDTRTSHLIIRIGHLMKQILTMLLKKRCVYFIFDFTQCFREGNGMSYTFLCAVFVKSHDSAECDVKKRCVIWSNLEVIKGLRKKPGHLSVFVLQFIILKLIVFTLCQEAWIVYIKRDSAYRKSKITVKFMKFVCQVNLWSA